MIGATKRVLVVEDDQTVRGPLVDILRSQGFRAEGAATVAETRELVTIPFDVAVLDKAMKDPKSSATGFDLGCELREAQPDAPPELVAYSAHSEPEDYETARKAGISDYIVKGTPGSEDIIDRIRLAALRSALNPVRLEVGEWIERIAEEEFKVATAVRNLCADIIKPELEVCLGVPSIFIVSDAEGTEVLNGNIPAGSERGDVYGEIQKRVIENHGFNPFTFSQSELGMPAEAADIMGELEGGRFASFNLSGDVQLSMGILQPKKPDSRKIDFRNLELEYYVNPPIAKLLKYLSRIERAVEAAKRKTLLGHTSRFCLYVAQTQLEVLNEVRAEDHNAAATPVFQKFKKLALDLQATGNEFSLLSESINQDRTTLPAPEPVSVTWVVKKAWGEVEEHFLLDKLKLRHIGDDFTLAIEENDLFVAVLRVLQWLAQREDKVSTETPTIDVEYHRRNDRLEISFTDQSRRLGGELRKKLFEPFTQIASTPPPKDGNERPGLYLPLYLAKTLIEAKNKGWLEDRTEELAKTTNFGHRFTIGFPVEENDVNS